MRRKGADTTHTHISWPLGQAVFKIADSLFKISMPKIKHTVLHSTLFTNNIRISPLKIFLNAVLERQNKTFLQTVLPTKKHAFLLVWQTLKWVKSSSNLQWIKHFSEKPAKQKKKLAENGFFLIFFQLFEFLLHVQNGFDCYF